MKLRALLLLASVGLLGSGCALMKDSRSCRDFDHARPIPIFNLDDPQSVARGVTVRGPYSEADAVAALELVRAQTDEWISSIDPPQEKLLDYQCGEIPVDALPTDQMEVSTAVDREAIHSSGTIYLLQKRRGEWAIRDSTLWFS